MIFLLLLAELKETLPLKVKTKSTMYIIGTIICGTEFYLLRSN